MNIAETKKTEIAPRKAGKRQSQRLNLDIEAVVGSIPERWRARYKKVLSGGGSYRMALHVKCADCVGFEEIVERVGGCTCERCPLWGFRPHQGGKS